MAWKTKIQKLLLDKYAREHSAECIPLGIQSQIKSPIEDKTGGSKMCQNHEKSVSVIKSNEVSLNILTNAHSNYTFECCPQIDNIEWADRTDAALSLNGVFPVYGSPMKVCNKVAEDVWELIRNNGTRIPYEVGVRIRQIFDYTSTDNWTNNKVEQDRFDMLKEAIKNQDLSAHNVKEFQLIKKSSPKISNIIASVLKWADKDPQNDPIMTQFNARQSAKMPGYDFIISAEPHRIVGMSAFGKFTSCQDWLRKDRGHDYHHYTHMSWANMLDETNTIAYIRKTSSEEPGEQNTEVEDMLARTLLRTVQIPNGQIVVYVHRIYGSSPYDQVMRETIDKWEKTLPENVRVLKIYDFDKNHYYNGENKHGVLFSDYKKFIHEQDEPVVECGKYRECNNCDGRGHHSCSVCNGDGSFWMTLYGEDCKGNSYEEECNVTCRQCDGEGTYECDECNGSGHFTDVVETENPYNDHSDWIKFQSNGISFQIPNWIWNWDVTPEDKEREDQEKYGAYKFKKGDKVVVRGDLTAYDVSYAMKHNGVHDYATSEQCNNYAGRVVEIDLIDETRGKYHIVGSSDWWTDEMFLGKEGEVLPSEMPLNQNPIQVGDTIYAKKDLIVNHRYNGLTLYREMLNVLTKGVTVTRMNRRSDGSVYYETDNFTYSEDMVTSRYPTLFKVGDMVTMISGKDAGDFGARNFEGALRIDGIDYFPNNPNVYYVLSNGYVYNENYIQLEIQNVEVIR